MSQRLKGKQQAHEGQQVVTVQHDTQADGHKVSPQRQTEVLEGHDEGLKSTERRHLHSPGAWGRGDLG